MGYLVGYALIGDKKDNVIRKRLHAFSVNEKLTEHRTKWKGHLKPAKWKHFQNKLGSIQQETEELPEATWTHKKCEYMDNQCLISKADNDDQTTGHTWLKILQLYSLIILCFYHFQVSCFRVEKFSKVRKRILGKNIMNKKLSQKSNNER